MTAVLLDDVHQVVLEVGEDLVAAQDPDAAQRPVAMRHVDAQRGPLRIDGWVERRVMRLPDLRQRPAISNRAARRELADIILACRRRTAAATPGDEGVGVRFPVLSGEGDGPGVPISPVLVRDRGQNDVAVLALDL